MNILDYINENGILFIEKTKKTDVLIELIEKAYELKFIDNREKFRKAIEEREAVISTGIGLGVAFPHAKLDSIKEFFVIIGILKYPVEWDSFDEKPVNIVFLIGGPENRQKDYLKILSNLMLIVKDKEKREKIINAKKSSEIIKILKE